ncbi:MAG TPA: GlxA family transcriptional regulator [Longimicrobiales bacterium]
MRRVLVLALPRLELLDLAGPVQVFDEANACGGDYVVELCSPHAKLRTAQGVWLSELAPLPEPGPDDLVVVPGMAFDALDAVGRDVHRWLRTAHERGAAVCSVCTGAFVLGAAGLLNGRRCTTHWLHVEALRRRHPGARVLDDRLFVEDAGVTTSAGIASGIDMALWWVEREHGPLVAARTARRLVVYLRRDGGQAQRSVYLDYRTHLDPGVHRVQDRIVSHPAESVSLRALARVAGMSTRSLTRAFRRATGLSVGEFAARVRLELARSLLHDPGLTIEEIARRSGFGSARQFRRVWKDAYGVPPSAERAAPRAGGRSRCGGPPSRSIPPRLTGSASSSP